MVLAAASAALGKRLFAKLVSELYGYAKQKLTTNIKTWDTEKKIAALYTKMSKVRKVKTLWQVDKAVDLMTFYCDSHVIIDKTRRRVQQIKDFQTDENILIEGIAGQGKSIFLRYLCARELMLGQYIPIFVELRRIQDNQTLFDQILLAFEEIGLNIDKELFDVLVSSGRVLLLLDAFDEVSQSNQERILLEVEHLSATKEHLRIIITSRPHTGLEASPHFRTIKLDNLIDNEYKSVIEKLSPDKDFTKHLVAQIDSHKGQIKDLLCTPLLVTLLVLTYKSYQKLPAQLSDFYDSLFQVVLQRHDGVKPGFKRKRSCPINDAQYRQVFETLCFLSKRTQASVFQYKQIYDLAKEALAGAELSHDPQAYITDIIRITCLILKDGDSCRFIHKSVQEYYSASFIRQKPDPWARTFYNKLRHSFSGFQWRQELRFLAEIDQYRYLKYLVLPTILEILQITEDDLENSRMPELTTELIIHAFGSIRFFLLPFEPSTQPPTPYAGWAIPTTWATLVPYDWLPHFTVLKSEFPQPLTDKAIQQNNQLSRPEISLADLFAHPQTSALIKQQITTVAQQSFTLLFARASSIQKTIKSNEREDILSGLV